METLRKFAEFIERINLDSGRNYKLSILESYKNDEDIKYYLEYVYNPYKITGISDKKLYKKFSSDIYTIISDSLKDATVKEVLEYLLQNNTGSDTTIRLLQEYRKYMDQGLVWLFDRVVTKNIQLGINTTSINKVIPNLIPEFNVMLAQKYFENPAYVEGKTFVLTTKIDGMRCIMMKENGNVTFWSRQGQPIEGLVDLEKEAKECFPDNVVFDGELIAKETSKEDTYKNTIKTATTKSAEKHNLKMMVFDYMPLEDFKAQHNEIRYWNRRLFLQKLWGNYYVDNKAMQCSGINELWKVRAGRLFPNMYKDTFEYFELLRDLYYGTDISKITEILEEQVANGEEGIMINIVDAPYAFKRSSNLLKCKLFNDTEVKVIGFEEGINKLAGTLGALICEYKGSTVKVGSGFTDKEREYIWWHKWEFENKLITVKYFEESYDSKTGQPSLRFPIYKGLRIDLC